MADKGILSLGMQEEQSGVLMLSIWKTGKEQSTAINLSKYVGEHATLQTVYPARAANAVTLQGSTLTVEFPDCDSAVWCKIVRSTK